MSVLRCPCCNYPDCGHDHGRASDQTVTVGQNVIDAIREALKQGDNNIVLSQEAAMTLLMEYDDQVRKENAHE
jgi:hypothetical protein